MKAVMLSIQPHWCELIASGKKTLEIRKTLPKLKPPFKCYIYCTKDRNLRFWTGKRYSYADDHSHNAFDRCGNGMVIGEFVCNAFVVDRTYGHDPLFCAAACFNQVEAASYCLNAKMYGWHISDLVIYNEPKPLSGFRLLCREYEKDFPQCGSCDYYHQMGEYPAECDVDGMKPVTRAPQSWCYVKTC